MTNLSPLETVVLNAIAALPPEVGDTMTRQIAAAQVISRENSGVGMFTELTIAPSAPPFAIPDWETATVVTTIDGVDLYCFAFIRSGFLDLLEGYVFEGETTGIDFLTAPFTPPRPVEALAWRPRLHRHDEGGPGDV